jgi:uncharacterized protein (TIGR03083 family)
MNITEIRPIDTDEMVDLATVEYRRLMDLLRALGPEEWARPTACTEWTVRDMVAHLLGAAEGNASVVESIRQAVRGTLRARRRGVPQIDGINSLQVEERADLTPDRLVAGLEAVAAKAVDGRRRFPGLLRRIRVSDPMGGTMSMAHLMDVIYTRDEWLHRVDISDATGRDLVLTPEHDGRIVADVVAEWSRRHGRPFELELTGPAGGTFRRGEPGFRGSYDAVEFCRLLSGRGDGPPPLDTHVTF